MSVQSDLQRASSLLDEGKFFESAALSAAIVAQEPRNAIATHLLGLAVKETGDWGQGEKWLRQSIALDPARAEFHANLANLLRRREKFQGAEKFYRQALALEPMHRAARRGLALTLTDLRRFGEAEAECRALLASDATDSDAWVLMGLALAGLERLAEAEQAYRKAISLNPENKVAHLNLGALLSHMDKPEAALAVLDQAGELGTDGYEMAFNRARAFLDMNDIEAAEREFERAATLRPQDADCQLHLARVRFMRGDPKFARTLAAASAAHRDDVQLQLLLADVVWRSGNHAGAEGLLRDLLLRKGPNPQVQGTLAAVLLEQGLLEEAEREALAAATAAPEESNVNQILVSILLARGYAADAQKFIEALRGKHPESQAWLAYEATAARLLGRDRYHELFDYDRLVRVFDLQAPPGWSSMRELNQAVSEVLSMRHKFNQHPLDQTLRNGTQTSRSLLTDDHPAIQGILKAFEAPIAEYRRLVGTDPGHPLSARNAGPARFTGAWSVRLGRDGFHVNHFHPDGWASSAYYVDVPPETRDPEHKSGWIKFGEPRYAVPGATPERLIEPRPGRLVLFPSYMWHGTNAIRGQDPRVTIAFDVKPGGNR